MLSANVLCCPEVIILLSNNVFFFLFLRIYLLFIYFCLRQVLVAAHGLFVAARGLLSSCGVRVFSSLVVARRLQGAWAL